MNDNQHLPQTLVRIGIDANEANVQNRVGSNVYAYELIKQLEEQTRHRTDVSFVIFLTDQPMTDMPPERAGWMYQIVKPKAFATQWALPLKLFQMRKQLDVFFTPGHYAPRISPIPYISSVMDLAFLHFPKQFKMKDFLQLKQWTQYSVKNSHHVVAISDYTKKDIEKKYKVKSEKISVLYPSINALPIRRENQNLKQEIFHKFKINAPYILYVGTIQPRKNIIRLIEAFEHLQLKYQSELKSSKKKNKGKSTRGTSKKEVEHPMKNVQLVLAGKTGWLSEPIVERIKSSKFASKIVMTGFITEEEKAILYYNAMCSVLVGLHEGFGMPALESLYYHVIPVVSNITSLPEVVGDAGILVDPYNENSIMRGLDQVLNLTQKERKEYEKKAIKQLEKFSWKESARKLLEVLIATATKKYV